MKTGVIGLVSLFLAVALQESVAPRIALGGALPHFPLILVGVYAFFLSPKWTVLYGAAAGLLYGAAAGIYLFPWVLATSFVGFVLGRLARNEVDGNPAAAGAVVAAITVVVYVLVLFLAPRSAIGPYLLATLGMAIYNGVLAVPVYAITARILPPPKRERYSSF